jgi:protein arginine kinase
MICVSCGENQAAVFIQEIVHNQVRQASLCVVCAEAAGAAAASAEKKARTALLGRPESRRRTEDSISRAAGILANARLVSFEEACRHLSLLRLGLVSELQGLPGSLAEVNALLVQTQPAHIEVRENRELSAVERDELRADYIRERLR